METIVLLQEAESLGEGCELGGTPSFFETASPAEPGTH